MGIELLNTFWPEWSVVEQIGEGSFGKVYNVERNEYGVTTNAAVKVISIPQRSDELTSLLADGYDMISSRSYFEGIMTDFVNEVKLMLSMKGAPNIVNLEDFKVVEKQEEIGWYIFIRMELLTSFVDYTVSKKPDENEVIKLGIDICSALELCSQKNIIHRDIKPENIFVSPYGDFKVGDFGIARELEKTLGAMSVKGTFNYMAPEVYAAKEYDATVDTYSLGLVLYKLLNNNRLPFIDPDASKIMYQDRKNAIDKRLSGETLPPPKEANQQLANVILKASEYDPAKRYRSAFEMKNALETVENNTVDGTIKPLLEPERRDAGVLFKMIAIVSAVLVGFSSSIYYYEIFAPDHWRHLVFYPFSDVVMISVTAMLIMITALTGVKGAKGNVIAIVFAICAVGCTVFTALDIHALSTSFNFGIYDGHWLNVAVGNEAILITGDNITDFWYLYITNVLCVMYYVFVCLAFQNRFKLWAGIKTIAFSFAIVFILINVMDIIGAFIVQPAAFPSALPIIASIGWLLCNVFWAVYLSKHKLKLL